MTVATETLLQIEAPRNHSPEIQEKLRQLLDSGAPMRPDPKRPGFFEIENQTHGFYIYVAKASGKVTLLAVWNREAENPGRAATLA